jgi:hypothetical protein
MQQEILLGQARVKYMSKNTNRRIEQTFMIKAGISLSPTDLEVSSWHQKGGQGITIQKIAREG